MGYISSSSLDLGERDQVGDYDLVIGLEDEKDVCRLVSGLKSEKMIGAYLDRGKIAYTPSAWFDMSIISRFGLDQANRLKKRTGKPTSSIWLTCSGSRFLRMFSVEPDEMEYGRKVVRDLGIGKGKR